jgi:hypothetical protein
VNLESDHDAVKNTVACLTAAGCPEVRPGQGSVEFSAKMKKGEPTPDIVAGPLYGNEDPRDFYVDVQSPSCDYFIKPGVNAEETKRAREVFSDFQRTGILDVPALDTLYIQRYMMHQFERKVAKYAERRHSPLYGHVFYFDISGDAPLHRVAGALDHLTAFCAMVSHDCGEESAKALFTKGETASAQFREISWPHVLFSFLALVMVRAEADFSFVLLRNAPIRSDPKFSDNPVVRWLSAL